MNAPRWRRGETVVMQDVWRGRLWSARPMIVVRDTDEYVALWMPKGTLWRSSTTPATRPRPEERSERILSCLEQCDWVMQERELGLSLLWYIGIGDSYATTLSWSGSGELGVFYVNVQEPVRRTERGFRTMDLLLDVVIQPDGAWSLKDEDELKAAQARGLIDPLQAAVLRVQARQAVDVMKANEPPFCEPWLSWRPEASWGLPALPEGWERVDEPIA
jgi:predicted RNA-binding protein associated with RNAse of E/G family